MTKTITLIKKEWADAFRNRYVMLMIILMPLFMVGLPIGVLAISGSPDLVSGVTNDIPPQLLEIEPYASLPENDAMQAFVGQQFNLFFLILPLAIPMTIATYSIVGEKRDRSLEPLLATPISTPELLAGKAIAAATPGVISVWASGLIYAIALQIVIANPDARAIVLSPAFFVSIVLIAPLITVLATLTGLMISSRVNDPRTAEQFGMILVLPFIALVFGQIAGVLTFSNTLAWVLAAILLVVDGVLLMLAVRLFSRETILTRWK
jgi:ABC-type Na+ efflux pump permease subunit